MPDNHITIEDVTLRFRLCSARSHSIKEAVVNAVLRRHYGKPPVEITAVDGVSLRIPHGRRLGIIGDNGAGKSSLLKVVARIYPPTTGRVSHQGFMVPILEVGIGFNPELSGVENIYLVGAIMGFSRRLMTRRVAPILDFADLRDFADTPVKYYSSGMAQRLAFSIATEIEPEILLLDEVFSVGDIHWIEKAQRRMQTLIDRSSIMVLVSHQMDMIERYCDQVAWMQSGRVVRQGSPAEVIPAYRAAVSTPVSTAPV